MLDGTEMARERENINQPEHTADHSQNKAIPEKSEGWRTRPPPAGGRRWGEGKGANSAPETASPTKLQTGSQFLTKDFLRFWMVDIRREGRG